LTGSEPSIEQARFSDDERRGRWLPVLVPAPGYGGVDSPANLHAVTVHQDAALYATRLEPGQSVAHRFRSGCQGYLFVVRGAVHAATDRDAVEIDAGGAAKIEAEPEVGTRAPEEGAEALLVETRTRKH
jgi:redox-sensitive bicupin YhaK (pirin superfamily)